MENDLGRIRTKSGIDPFIDRNRRKRININQGKTRRTRCQTKSTATTTKIQQMNLKSCQRIKEPTLKKNQRHKEKSSERPGFVSPGIMETADKRET